MHIVGDLQDPRLGLSSHVAMEINQGLSAKHHASIPAPYDR